MNPCLHHYIKHWGICKVFINTLYRYSWIKTPLKRSYSSDCPSVIQFHHFSIHFKQQSFPSSSLLLKYIIKLTWDNFYILLVRMFYLHSRRLYWRQPVVVLVSYQAQVVMNVLIHQTFRRLIFLSISWPSIFCLWWI